MKHLRKIEISLDNLGSILRTGFFFCVNGMLRKFPEVVYKNKDKHQDMKNGTKGQGDKQSCHRVRKTELPKRPIK